MLNNLGAFAFHAGDWREAVVLYRRAGNASAQAGDVVNAAFGDCNVGEVLVEQGRLTAADEALRRALQVWRGSGYDSGVAYATALLGRAAVHQGRSDVGRGLVQRALAKFRQLGHEPEAQMAEALLAEALVFGGHAERALQDIEALAPRLLDARLRAAARAAPRAARSRSSATRDAALAALDVVARARARAGRRLRRRRGAARARRAGGDDPRAPAWRRESQGAPRAARRRPAAAPDRAPALVLAAHLRVDRAARQPRDQRDPVVEQAPLLDAGRLARHPQHPALGQQPGPPVLGDPVAVAVERRS